MASLKFIRNWLYRFGLILFVFGIALICIGIAGIVLKSRLHNIGHGIIAGVYTTVIGALCIYFKKITLLRAGSFLLVALSLAGVLILCPACLLLFMGEIVADTSAHYYRDPPLCKEGCDWNTGHIDGFEIEFNDENRAMALSFDCDSSIWKETCTENLKSVYNAMAGSIFIIGSWILLIAVVTFGFIVLFLCCGVKDETVKPYEGSNTTEYNQYPVAYPCDMSDTHYYGYAERTALFPKVDEDIAENPSKDQYIPPKDELLMAHHVAPTPATPECVSPEMTSPPPNPPNEIL